MLSERGRLKPITAIIIVVLGIAAIGSIFISIYVQNRDRPQLFYIQRRSMGQRLLDEVRTYDLVNHYPETVEEVMHLYSILRRMIYGRMVSDDELLYELVGLQRHLLCDFLTQNNTHRDQWLQVLEDTSVLYESNVFIHSIDKGLIFISAEEDMCIVPLTFTMINHEAMYWNYFLKLEHGRWKIHDFKRMDSTFMNEIED